MRILAVALLFIVGLPVGDVSGNWHGSFRVDGGDHYVPQLLLLKEDGTKLTDRDARMQPSATPYQTDT